MEASDWTAYEVGPEDVRRARRGYFANISYVDQQIGAILGVLDRCGMAEETVVLFTSDHGDMLGERGLWFKMSLRDGSARVPLLLAGPGIAAGRIDRPVSLLDVVPTLAELGGAGDVSPWVDGESLLSGSRGPVPIEYAAEGSVAPMVALRDGRFKLVLCRADPPTLFDLVDDPGEGQNLAGDEAFAGVLADLTEKALARWALEAFDLAVRDSQARRRLVYEALRRGVYTGWDFQPHRDAGKAYMRNHMDLNLLEAEKRFPKG